MKSKQQFAGLPGLNQSSNSDKFIPKQLSVSAVDSRIAKLSLVTLQHMWNKAEELLNDRSAISPAPGNDKTARMVLSNAKCDASCLNWVSSKLCSHSLAVAELNNDLVTFLEWYKNSSDHPNITSVAMASLSSGRGCKGGVPKRKRCRKKMDGPEVSALSIQHPNNFPSAPFNSSVGL